MEHGYGTSFDVHGIISYQGIWDMGNPTLKINLIKEELVTIELIANLQKNYWVSSVSGFSKTLST